jgi:DNA-directed RNA polymerase specialized sigma24 family protein
MVTEVDGGPIARRDDRLGELELLYRESAVRLARAIYAFSGGRRQVAEDAVAEAFARAIARRDSIRVPLPWIYRTAFRIASRELRRERRSLAAPPDLVPGSIPRRSSRSSRRSPSSPRTSAPPWSCTTRRG